MRSLEVFGCALARNGRGLVFFTDAGPHVTQRLPPWRCRRSIKGVGAGRLVLPLEDGEEMLLIIRSDDVRGHCQQLLKNLYHDMLTRTLHQRKG